MSARKLQQEIDKTTKKISEGLQAFDDIHDKLITSEIASQKEKLESDLKKEIKRLQRSRDQLKHWIGDSSLKIDKVPLIDFRIKIETAMDQFKEVEKQSKLKQFSNEGLELQRSRTGRFSDPDNLKKQEACNYISDVIDQLNQQNETLEAEVHQLASKKKGGLVQSLEETKHAIERNTKHLDQLEKVLRNLENSRLDPEKIDEIKDDLDYYVENNREDDYVEYDDFYEQLDLDDDLEVHGTLDYDHDQKATPKKKAAPATSSTVVKPATIKGPPPGLGTDSPSRPSQSQLPVADESKTFWDTVPRLSTIPQSRLHSPLPFSSISQLLELSLLNCPDSFDAEKPRQYNPRNVHPSSVDYPQEPMYELNLSHVMRKFDNDTLFFCFYYSDSANHLARWNAAKELSRRGWVFNTDLKQWFAKDSKNGKPRSMSVVHKEEELGISDKEESFKYFDYEKTWLTRRKDNYLFPSTLRLSF